MVAVNHSIKLVSKRTGLSPHVIRVWEKRYQAVKPERSATNRRLYSEEEIERLKMLKLATVAGHSIRNIAGLPTEELKALVERDAGPAFRAAQSEAARHVPPNAARFIGEAMTAITRLDGNALEAILSRAVVEFGQQGFLQQVLVPVIENVGNSWSEGDLKVAHEHIATAVIRTFLGTLSRSHSVPSSAPELIVTTPSGQLHELGAVLAAATANTQGWRSTYLGPCLPAEEIAGAVLQNKPRAVALSIVYPDDDPHLGEQLRLLHRLMPEGTPLVVGGRAARRYEPALKEIGALIVDDLAGLKSALDRLRQRTAAHA